MTHDTLATHDDVESPSHYNSHPSRVECRQIARHLPYNLGCAFKYLFRAGLKGDALTDYRKALNYIKDELKINSDDAIFISYEQIAELAAKYSAAEPNKMKKRAVSALLLANANSVYDNRKSFLDEVASCVQRLIDNEINQ